MKNDKSIFKIIAVVSALIFVAVLLLNRKVFPAPDNIPSFVFYLPGLNACINATCSVLLAASFFAIKNKKQALHKKLNLTAFLLSSIFLISYVTVHFFIPDTRFGDANHNGILDPNEAEMVSGIRPVYLFILLSHILLAVIVLPLVLISFYFGLSMQNEKHKKIVRFSFPVWLYVTVTGVIVYWMISPYYPF